MAFANLWSRFIWWLEQGQNATAIQAIAALVVGAVTVVYVILTYWIMKSTGRQARAALQPALSVCRFQENPPDPNVHTILIENKADRPVMFLDVTIGCTPMHHTPIIKKWGMGAEILSSHDDWKLRLDFTKELADLHTDKSNCAFWVVMVVSDLSKQVAITYEYSWVLGHLTAREGIPFKVRWRYRLRPFGWRYYRIKYGIRDGWNKLTLVTSKHSRHKQGARRSHSRRPKP